MRISMSMAYWVMLFSLLGGYTHSLQFENKERVNKNSKKLSVNGPITGIIDNIKYSQKYINIYVAPDPSSHLVINSKRNLLLKIKASPIPDQLRIGMGITWHSKMINPCIQSTHNSYYDYLCQKNISLVSYSNFSQLELSEVTHNSPIPLLRYYVRPQGIALIQKHLSEKSSAVVLALLFGNKEFIDKTLRKSFSDSGTAHVLAVSGMHVGIIATLLLSLFRTLFFRVHKNSWFCILPTIIGIILFTEISGGAPPVRRASAMAITYLIARTMALEYSNLNILGLVGSLLILIQPSNLFSLSFQFSFMAVGGIILIFPIIDQSSRFQNKWLKQICILLQLGIAAQLALIPLSLFYFQRSSWLSPLTSIWSIMLIYFIIVLSLTLLVCIPIHTVLVSKVGQCLDFFTDLLSKSTQFFSHIPFTSIYAHINLTECILLVAAALFLTLSFYSYKRTLLRASCILYLSQSIYHLQQKLF